ncbi:hypothetical protein GCM10010272_40410 [Streptomyces lateritius]|nr:hypothetical protein [Streptomyces sp. QHH-9511]GGT91471.1 hypothetical protein GCM10010272_40410 [Streptomyces lateritius]
MRRGATARTVFSFLAAVLLAFQLIVSTASFAYAHTARHAVAKAQPAVKPAGEATRDEIVTCHGPGRPGDPTGPLRTRDRSRTADNPGISERPLPAHHTSVAPESAASGSPRHHASRPSRAHAPAVLQVFRC